MANAGAAADLEDDAMTATDKLADEIVKKINGHPIGTGIIALTKVLILALMQIPDVETRLAAHRKMSARVARIIRKLSVSPDDEEPAPIKPKKRQKAGRKK